MESRLKRALQIALVESHKKEFKQRVSSIVNIWNKRIPKSNSALGISIKHAKVRSISSRLYNIPGFSLPEISSSPKANTNFEEEFENKIAEIRNIQQNINHKLKAFKPNLYKRSMNFNIEPFQLAEFAKSLPQNKFHQRKSGYWGKTHLQRIENVRYKANYIKQSGSIIRENRHFRSTFQSYMSTP
jgi:hypothetical protein